MKLLFATTILLAALLSQCGYLHAQDTYISDSLKVTALPEFVLRGKQHSEVVPSQSLTGEELERLSSHSVADALRYFSGMQVKDYGGIGGLKTVNIRSMGSQHVGVFFDGVQISNAQNGFVDLGKFSLDNMELLSVYNGQKSDIFQTAKDFASASALYMVTRRPQFADGRRNNVTVKLKTGSFDLINSSALWETKINDKLSSSINAEVLNTSGKYKFRVRSVGGYDTTEVRQNGDVFYVRGEAALFGKMKNGDWQAKAYYYGSTRGYPGSIALDNDIENRYLNEDRQTDRNFFVQGSMTKKAADFYSLKLNAKYAYDFMHYWSPRNTTRKLEDTRYWQREAYVSLSNLFTINRFWSVNASVDYQHNRLNARALLDDSPFNTNFVQPRRNTILGALATSLKLRKISVQASILYTHIHEWAGQESGVSTDVPEDPDSKIADDKNVFAPTVIASYRPFDDIDLAFRAFYKEIFRMPTFNDLYYVNLGRRTLKPEYSTQYNIGATYSITTGQGRFTGFGITADVYYNEVRDKIIAIPVSSQTIWTMINLGLVEIRGVDFTANAGMKFGDLRLNGRLSYTYQQAQDFTEDATYNPGHDIESRWGDQIPYIPWHSGSVILNAAYGSWEVNYSFIYTGQRYRLGANIPVNYISPWYTHDISVVKTFRLKNSTLKAGLEVNNILNQQYEVVDKYPMPGTNFKVNLTFIL